jgi:hypothetical protein
MLLLLITIAVSVTLYLIYLIFYPLSTNTEKALDRIDSTFKIILVYAIVFVVLVADLYTQDRKVAGMSLLLLFLYIIFALVILNMVLW